MYTYSYSRFTVVVIFLVGLFGGIRIAPVVNKYTALLFSHGCSGCCGHKKMAPVVAAKERTFALIKPDAVAAGHVGAIISMIEKAGFTIVQMTKKMLSRAEVDNLYGIHKDRPFFADLVAHITSGPVVVLVLERDNAVQIWRDLMGATDPEKAVEGTIRRSFGLSVTANATHGSDSVENALREISIFQ